VLDFEKRLWLINPGAVVAGVDEAGRGCLAGPVVAGAVSISNEAAERLYAGDLAGLNDSKQLTAAQRDHFFGRLTALPEVSWATGLCSAAEIDRINILAATHLAMRRAVEALAVRPEHLLVDGLPVKGLPCASTAIVRGDSKSFLIAAASVIAKVTRDRLMRDMDARYPAYGFAAHKGYGVHGHMAALFRHGSCAEHRHTFRPVQDADQKLPGFEY